MINNPYILVTNDDGIDSQGMKILERIAKKISNNVYIIAPNKEQSAKSHSITLTEPLRIEKKSRYKFSVSGTPTDCVILGVNEVMPRIPDLLLSGINCGANIAEDISYSGTIAAAIEGTLMGIKSIALSQVYLNRKKISWDISKNYSEEIILKILRNKWDKNVLLNINFPHKLSKKKDYISITKQGKRAYEKSLIEKRFDPRGDHYYWLGYRKQKVSRNDSSDLAAIAKGYISISPLKIDFTHNSSIKTLGAIFK